MTKLESASSTAGSNWVRRPAEFGEGLGDGELGGIGASEGHGGERVTHRDHARPMGICWPASPSGHDPHLRYTTSIIELAQDRITARSNSGPGDAEARVAHVPLGAALSPDGVAQCA